CLEGNVPISLGDICGRVLNYCTWSCILDCFVDNTIAALYIGFICNVISCSIPFRNPSLVDVSIEDILPILHPVLNLCLRNFSLPTCLYFSICWGFYITQRCPNL